MQTSRTPTPLPAHQPLEPLIYDPEEIKPMEEPYQPEQYRKTDENELSVAATLEAAHALLDSTADPQWDTTSWDPESMGDLDDAILYGNDSLLAHLPDELDPETESSQQH
jgi:hypothetical protein